MNLKVLCLLLFLVMGNHFFSMGSTEKEIPPRPTTEEEFGIYCKDSFYVTPSSIILPKEQYIEYGTEKEILFGQGTIKQTEVGQILILEFYYDYNNISLTLESNNNVLYKIENIDIKAGDTLEIDISELPSGSYTLRGHTANKTTLKGEFTL